MEVCYRHPGRETGVACSNCGRPICPDCMTSTSVGMRCPECAKQGATRVRTMRSIEDPVLTYALIGINVIIGIGAFLGGASATTGGIGQSQLLEHGALYGPAIADGQYWRIVTGGFLHAGFLHLAFNMFALYVLGTMLEPAVGRLRFGLIYGVSLLAGSFGALVATPNAPTVGASGAIFGLMGAAVVVMRNRGINPMESGLPLWIGINLVFTLTIPGISIGGHIGGLIGGAVAGVLLFGLRDRVRAVPAMVPTVLCVALAVAAAVGSIAVSSSSAGV